MNVSIIVAAGSGTRFGADRPKQFLEIGGKPLLIHTLEKFQNCNSIDEIVLILSANEIENFQKTLTEFPITKLSKIIAGGKTRAESVRNGIFSLDSEKTEIVAVHDGARPFVSSEEIAETVENAKENTAVCLVAPVFDTIKKVENGKIIETIDRNSLRRSLTPQTFKFEILKQSFSPENFDENATDECFLVEKAGHEIFFIDGSPKNIKITTREDFQIAEMFLKNEIGF
ncbi:MAG TPA: 2-C-methyl-D-erythritol 4-phosphate cytidylyltransferase [Pyrinomonadaceae bacterium]|nr:2-C-methyl-D-erythritol 4-phosphate cytidylyltransferase [Pyrinomonadaceae bacterium]